MSVSYDDELWELVPESSGPSPVHIAGFVDSLGPVGDALDLGCGDGRLSEHLDARALTLADVSAVALARAKGRLPAARIVQLEPDCALPLEDCTFDLVLCAETVEHVRDLQLLLSEARRVLRPGGRLAVTTPAHGRTTGLDAALRGFERVFQPLSPHIRFLTRRSLTRLLTDRGFRVESVRRRRRTLLALASR